MSLNAACGSGPFGSWRRHFSSSRAGALWVLGSGGNRVHDNSGEKPSQPGFARGKQANRPTGVGNAPLLVLRTTSPKGKHVTGFSGRYKSSSFATPEGEVLAALCLEVLMRLKAERRANLPHRGRCRRQKGYIVWFSLPPIGGIQNSSPAGRYHHPRAKGPSTFPSEPSEPFEPCEPGLRLCRGPLTFLPKKSIITAYHEKICRADSYQRSLL